MRRKQTIRWAAILAAAFSVFGAVLFVGTPAGDEKRLIGRWVRLDGGYILEVQGIGKSGSLKAGYFNPRSINVARAEYKRKDAKLTVFIELRDVNYPGSTYSLQYDPGSDRLKGTYFQAVEKLNFVIEFVRAK